MFGLTGNRDGAGGQVGLQQCGEAKHSESLTAIAAD
jgi:hypothetical protein